VLASSGSPEYVCVVSGYGKTETAERMKGRQSLVFGVLLVGAIATGAYVLFSIPAKQADLGGSLTASVDEATSTPPASDGGVEIPVAPQAITATPAPGSSEYHNSAYHFSLIYPSSYTVTEFKEQGGGMTVTFQKPSDLAGFQIFITPYTATSITPERFKLDIPSGVVKSPVEVVIGNNIHALHFMSVAPIIGDSSETWFIRDAHLFEVTAYASLDTQMASILKTLQFDR